jgi:DNA topoisomerase-6 subunit B
MPAKTAEQVKLSFSKNPSSALSDTVLKEKEKAQPSLFPPLSREMLGGTSEKGSEAKGSEEQKSDPAASAPVQAVLQEPLPNGMSNGSIEPASLKAPVQREFRKDREDAHTLAKKQREISVSEFFTKNRHLLGFDNPAKALLTTVKEAVDNSLDACEDAGILPSLTIEVRQVGENRYKVSIRDNGPGILGKTIPNIFGRLLYGSKFHRMKQARGQQGIGISAAGMYGQLTTGKPVIIMSKLPEFPRGHYYEVRINTQRNYPQVAKNRQIDWEHPHGTEVQIELEAMYKKGKHSVDDYVEQTAMANPHAEIVYRPPSGETIQFPRLSEALPPESVEIKPHPYGVELGALMKMMKETDAESARTALQQDFCRVNSKIAFEILYRAGVDSSKAPRALSAIEVEKIFRTLQDVKIMAPPSNSLSPIGEALIVRSLENRARPDFCTSVTRPPSVYRGNPFRVEVGLAYGGNLPGEELAEVLRFANRVPLLYQQSSCVISKAILQIDWKKYGLQQGRGALPTGPLLFFAHIASVWVPFTSESKEAIAHYPEILREFKLAFQDCGRRLGLFVRARRRAHEEDKKRMFIEKYIPHVGAALRELLNLKEEKERQINDTLREILKKSRS